MHHTDQLDLRQPTAADVEPLFGLYSDARLWTHFPSLRHTDPAQTQSMMSRWIDAWERNGLGPWIALERGTGELVGHGGCDLRHGQFWNLGYRFHVACHGRGFATEVSRAAIRQAGSVRPDVPIVAYLLEHNPASARVAEKCGLALRHRGPDVGNPDPAAVRLVYADRELSPEQLVAAMS